MLGGGWGCLGGGWGCLGGGWGCLGGGWGCSLNIHHFWKVSFDGESSHFDSHLVLPQARCSPVLRFRAAELQQFGYEC